jgi:K+-transporting ATPase c subunit
VTTYQSFSTRTELGKQLVSEATVGRWLGIIGEPMVNGRKLNMALDAVGGKS